MPSPFAHLTTGYLIYRLYKNRLPDSYVRFLGISPQLSVLAGVSILPDLDAVPGILLGDMSRFHNNVSHSLFAGLLSAVVLASVFSRKRKASWASWFVIVLLAYDLHIVLDLFTSDRGLMLLWPLPARFTSPVKLFYGVQWGLGFLSIWHLWTIFTEALFFAGLVIAVKVFVSLKRSIVISAIYR